MTVHRFWFIVYCFITLTYTSTTTKYFILFYVSSFTAPFHYILVLFIYFLLTLLWHLTILNVSLLSTYVFAINIFCKNGAEYFRLNKRMQRFFAIIHERWFYIFLVDDASCTSFLSVSVCMYVSKRLQDKVVTIKQPDEAINSNGVVIWKKKRWG